MVFFHVFSHGLPFALARFWDDPQESLFGAPAGEGRAWWVSAAG
jgi:hypothetical protein